MLAWIIEVAVIFIAVVLAASISISWSTARKVERAVPPIGDFIEVDGTKLHYVDRGEGSPVVMIHGLGGNLYQYTGTIFDDIASTGRAIAIDRPGCGYSERPGEYGFSTQEQANIIQKALDKLGVKDPLIVGHSFGGGVALAHAVLHPGKARGYVLIAPAAGKPRSIPPMFKGLNVPAPMRPVIAWTIGVPMSIKAGPQLTAQIFAPQPVPSDFATESGGLLALRPKALITNMNDFAASGPSFQKSRKRYGEISAPVLCLYGLSDHVLDAEFQLDALKPIPALEVQRLDAAGHMLMHVEPRTVIAAIRKLDTQTAASAPGAGAIAR